MMVRKRAALVLGVAVGLAAPHPAFAHAHLKQAVPGVDASVSGSPGELQLTFTEKVETALSGVSVATAAGAAVATAKPTGEGSSSGTLHVKLDKPLAAGTYVVRWHVVAVDTHKTSGTYKFTVSP